MNKSFTYYEVGIYETCESDIVLKQFRNKESAVAYYNHLLQLKKQCLEECEKYPLGDDPAIPGYNYKRLAVYTEEGGYVWGDAFEELGDVIYQVIDDVEKVKEGKQPALHGRQDFYYREQVIDFDD